MSLEILTFSFSNIKIFKLPSVQLSRKRNFNYSSACEPSFLMLCTQCHISGFNVAYVCAVVPHQCQLPPSMEHATDVAV